MDSFLIFNKNLKYESNWVYQPKFLSIFEEKEEFSSFNEFLQGNLEILKPDFFFERF